MKPVVYDLFTGLHGWLTAFLEEGYRCVGFDIVDMCAELGVPRPDGIEFIQRDVRSIHGSEFVDAAIIVASPPCQAYSYRAMPWSRAKALPPPDNTLFNECFRIQREASEAAGRYIPMVVENVRGAQKWVGQARWHYGSFYLWGDVPALMPMTFKLQKQPGRNFHFPEKYGIPSPSFHGADHEPSVIAAGLKTQGLANIRDGVKNEHGGSWYGNYAEAKAAGKLATGRGFSSRSRSRSRKAASAMIAKIPYPLAQHIARTYYPAP